MDIRQGFSRRTFISKRYMVELHRRDRFGHGGQFFCSVLHIRPDLKHTFNPVPAGDGLGHRDDQVGQFHQFDQDLSHIVEERHDLALGQVSDIDPQGAGIDERDRPAVYHHIGQRIHQAGDPADELLCIRERLVL